MQASDALVVQHRGKGVMAIEVELQPERRPCWHTQIAQSEIRQDKVEIIVKVLGRGSLEKSSVGAFKKTSGINSTENPLNFDHNFLRARREIHSSKCL